MTAWGRECQPPVDGDTPVLVAVMNNRQDLRRAQEEGWYRIPLGRAPSPLGAHYLALYLTGVFGAEGQAVRYWAEIERCEVRARKELLPQEARHPRADQPYLCLRLGPLQTLERPVRAGGWRRLAFIPTTWGRLREAHEVRELCLSAKRPPQPGWGESGWV